MRHLHEIKDIRFLNKLLGKRTLFIEAPTITRGKIIPFIKKHKVKRLFCLSPIDPNESKFPDKIEDDFEKASLDLYSYLHTELRIEIVPHVHIHDDCSYEEAKEKVVNTLELFKKIGIESKEIYFGWGLRTPMFQQICKELNLKISKKMYHYYDFWIEDN